MKEKEGEVDCGHKKGIRWGGFDAKNRTMQTMNCAQLVGGRMAGCVLLSCGDHWCS